MSTPLPAGFGAYTASVGVRDDAGLDDTGLDHTDRVDDLVVVAASSEVAAAGVFTRSRFAGPSVTTSRAHVADGRAQAVVVISKNANVANGPIGERHAAAVVDAVAEKLGCSPGDVLIASTGVIGRTYPIERILAGIAALPAAPPGELPERTIDRAARGIMTTDTVPKTASAPVAGSPATDRTATPRPATVVGMAKGVGMLEPNMATMIAVLLTDADVEPAELDARFRRVVDRTFNCVSIDTDTSTSDTAIALASGAAGPVDGDALEAAMFDVARSLTRQIASDGEGAHTLIEVTVGAARDAAQAKRVGKSIVNSPLVKTAVYGADPNWGRVAAAIGKCDGPDDDDIDPDRVIIRFGDQEVYPIRVDEDALSKLSGYLAGDEVLIDVTLGTGEAACTVWGCDLTDDYIRINADYTT